MRNKTIKKVKTTILTSISCDICGEEYEKHDLRSDEFFVICHRGGYSFKIGDGVGILLDICDECFLKMFNNEIIEKGIENYNEEFGL